MGDIEGGASVVVGARESRAQGEGKQEDGRLAWRRSDLWTRIIRPMRPGYSAFNASSISGVRPIPTDDGETCGIGLPISAIFAIPGGASPRTKASGPPGSTG